MHIAAARVSSHRKPARASRVAMLAILLAMPALAHAACPGGKRPVFACTTTKGKAVQVCDAGKTIAYTFGTPGATPDMALSVPRAAASTYQWSGVGAVMRYSVRIPNGETVYEVFDAVDRNARTATSGIDVAVAGKHVATLACRHGSTVANIEDIALRAAD